MQCKEYIKIGVSQRPEQRIKDLQIGNPFKIILLLKIIYDDCYGIEKKLHNYFDKNNVSGEWFSIDKDIKDLVKYLKNIEYEMEKKNG